MAFVIPAELGRAVVADRIAGFVGFFALFEQRMVHKMPTLAEAGLDDRVYDLGDAATTVWSLPRTGDLTPGP